MYYPAQNYYNPYLQNQQQMYQNPAMNNQYQLPAMQQYAANLQQTVIQGKYISKIEDITANDVPMSGESAIFPMSDASKIYLKKWNSNGTISTVEFCPITNEKELNDKSINELNKIDLKPITERLDGIEDMLNKLTNKRTQKKESETE